MAELIYWHNPKTGAVWSDVDVRFHCKDTTGWTRIVLPPPAGAQQAVAPGPVPDSVWEALQRMIEDGLVKGPASQEDARTVMRYRDRVRFLATPAGAQQAVADEREAFLDHWVKDVPEEYRAAARERADKDLLLSLDRGPLRVAADAWQARAALAAPAAADDAHMAALQLKPDDFYAVWWNTAGDSTSTQSAYRSAWFKCINELRLRGLLSATPAPEAAPSAKEGEADKAVSDLAQAVAFLDQVRVAAKNGEEVTSTGISRDASQWLERAARSVVSALKGLTPGGGDS